MFNGKPVICISNDSNALRAPEAARQIESPKAYSAAIANAGGIPWVTSEFCAEELAEMCDGLLLAGGADVDPALFGEEILNDTIGMDKLRDEFEYKLIPEFLKRNKPILCICRGLQILNIYMGGNVYQDLVEQMGLVHMNTKIRHLVFNEEGSLMHKFFGDTVKVNSTHHQAVCKVAEGFRVTSRSAEGLVEAMEHETLPIIAFQFHPERLSYAANDGRTPDFAPVFEHYINMCIEDAKKRA